MIGVGVGFGVGRFRSRGGGGIQPFTFTVDTTQSGTSASDQFTLPLTTSTGLDCVVDWGDGTTEDWTDFVTSGTEITLTHKWSKQGNYTVKAKAKDSYDFESNWSEYEVQIPRTKREYNLFFHWLLDRFPMMERLFKLIKLNY